MNTTLASTTVPSGVCAQGAGDHDQSYNLKAHIISIFVILILSLFGAVISVVSSRVEYLRINPIIINTAKFFGSGVVLATGFIHMLPSAMKALTDDCLPASWKLYDAFAGLFAMLAAMAMQLFEYIAHQRYRSIESNRRNVNMNDHFQLSAHYHGFGFQDDNESTKISTYLLEFGIALHSLLIGLALGTATKEFFAVSIALCCHQFFEGMALGAQIALSNRISLRSAFFMVVFFALTTPFGIAVGIGIHSKAYNSKSVGSLLTRGILNSVSGGILIYVALVSLISTEMGRDAHAFHALNKRLKFLYFGALYIGAITMAVVGFWA